MLRVSFSRRLNPNDFQNKLMENKSYDVSMNKEGENRVGEKATLPNN